MIRPPRAPFRRMLQAPFTRRAWAELAYAVVSALLAACALVFIVATLGAGLLWALSAPGVRKLGAGQPRAGPRAARVRAILSVAIVGLSLILAIGLQSNFLTNYTNFILLLLYVLIPWTAINLVDYYLIRHGEYDVEAFFDPSGGPYGRVGGIGIAAYIVGMVVTVPLYYLLAIRQGTRRPAAAPEPVRN